LKRRFGVEEKLMHTFGLQTKIVIKVFPLPMLPSFGYPYASDGGALL
jgi:hypothetical protein